MLHIKQEDRNARLVRYPGTRAYRKAARVLARQLFEDCTVETDRGVMRAYVGDWLVTNHPDDDAESDLWTISDERMRSTYEATGD